jgi:hypothetical protein
MRTKFELILFAAVLLLLVTAGALYMRFHALQKQYSIAMNNFKAYEQLVNAKIDSTKLKNYELKMTKEMLEYSNDSIIRDLNELRKELKIKDKKLQQMQQINLVTTKHDSIYFTDTIFKDMVNIDTTLADEWRTLRLLLSFPGNVSVESSFNNKVSVIMSTEKQTINPPSKIFFIRWFQKKQQLVKVDVIDANPYASVKEQRFIEIIK